MWCKYYFIANASVYIMRLKCGANIILLQMLLYTLCDYNMVQILFHCKCFCIHYEIAMWCKYYFIANASVYIM